MAGYNEIISRTDPDDPLVPVPIAKQVIEEAPKQSVVLSRARRVPMSSKKAKQPVLTALPKAYWVNGDTGLKQTTKQMWDNVFIVAEELASIVVIPDAYFDDAEIPLWDSVRPYLVEAAGLAVDEAALFGIDKPSTWPQAVIPGAISAGNFVVEGTTDDFGSDVALLGQNLATQGYGINGFASELGLRWKLTGLRDTQGRPIYGAGDVSQGQPSSLYGLPLNEVENGAWDPDEATLLGADWSKMVVGIRQDMTFKVFSEGVISDDEGKVVVNLMQQDSKALRLVFRVGFAIANPISRVREKLGAGNYYPAGVILPEGTGVSS